MRVSSKVGEQTVKTSGFDQDLKKNEILIGEQAQAEDIVAEARQQSFVVDDVTTKERKRNPVPPFITSKLQQEASRKLGFAVKKTMMLAQKLYEGVEIGDEGSVGLITYMRTDSTRVSDTALGEVRDFIEQPVRPRLSSGKSRSLSFEERRAGRARSDSPDGSRTHAGFAGEVSETGRVETLSVDLAALCRVADDAGGVRSNDDRYQRRPLHLPRDWFGAEV